MGMAFTGDNLQLGIWLEISGWGGDVETVYILPARNQGHRVGETIERIESAIANGTRMEGERYDGLISATGLQMTIVASYESVPWVLRLFCGEIDDSGGGPYVHTNADGFGDLTEGFGVEFALVDSTDPSSSLLYTCKGCEVTRVSMPVVPENGVGEIPITITFDAKSVTRTVGTPASGTTFSENPIVANDMSVLTINDGGGADAMVDVKSATLDINFGSGMVHTANNGGRVGFRYRKQGKARLNLVGVAHWASPYEALAAARTECTLICTITTGASEIYTLTLSGLTLSQQPLDIGTNEVMVTCNGDCDTPAWSVTNSEASYPTPV